MPGHVARREYLGRSAAGRSSSRPSSSWHPRPPEPRPGRPPVGPAIDHRPDASRRRRRRHGHRSVPTRRRSRASTPRRRRAPPFSRVAAERRQASRPGFARCRPDGDRPRDRRPAHVRRLDERQQGQDAGRLPSRPGSPPVTLQRATTRPAAPISSAASRDPPLAGTAPPTKRRPGRRQPHPRDGPRDPHLHHDHGLRDASPRASPRRNRAGSAGSCSARRPDPDAHRQGDGSGRPALPVRPVAHGRRRTGIQQPVGQTFTSPATARPSRISPAILVGLSLLHPRFRPVRVPLRGSRIAGQPPGRCPAGRDADIGLDERLHPHSLASPRSTPRGSRRSFVPFFSPFSCSSG